MKLRAGLVLSVSALYPLATARAAPDPKPFAVRLDYDAGGRCPGAAEFREIVIARLTFDPFDAAAPDQVIVRIRPLGGAFEGRVEWRDASGSWIGEQTFPLVASECSRLARAMGFAVAVQIQLLPTLRPVPVPDAVPVTKPALPVEAPVPAAVASPPPASRPALAAGAEAVLAGGLSSLPVPAGGVVGVLAWRRFSVEVAAEGSAAAVTRRADGAGVSQRELLASAAACAVRGRWRLCAVAQAGEVRMAGVDIDRPTSAVVPVVEAGARFGVRQALGRRLFVDAHADALSVLGRWTATLDRVPVWTAPRFTAAFGLGAGVRFTGEP